MDLRRLFVDFNAYFASVEQQTRPELRGRPVAVVPVMADTTSCIAASYEARKFGIKTGTRVGEAKRRCPGLMVVTARHEIYVDYHHRLMAVIDSVVPVDEVKSIDEVLCDLPKRWQAESDARAKALEIKERIAREVGAYLKCSIGIAPNGFLAKTAAEMNKPDGLTVLHAADLPLALFGLSLRDFSGIGPAMEQRLHRAGIKTAQQLCSAPRPVLRKIWGGIGGEIFYERLRGHDVPSAPTHRSSVSHSHVLPPKERNEADARAVINRLLQKAALRLRTLEMTSGTVSISVRCLGRERWDCDCRIPPTDDTADLSRVLNQAWDSQAAWIQKHRPLSVGVVLAGLQPRTDRQPELFDAPKPTKRLIDIADQAQRRFGKNAVYLGASQAARESAPMRIAFNRIPDPTSEA